MPIFELLPHSTPTYAPSIDKLPLADMHIDDTPSDDIDMEVSPLSDLDVAVILQQIIDLAQVPSGIASRPGPKV